MTKQIEGTVDDDVAVKLAIGEGRQADLEQERLELQALNSERFRHRFWSETGRGSCSTSWSY